MKIIFFIGVVYSTVLRLPVTSQNGADFLISGGTSVLTHEFPFIVSLQQLWGGKFYHFCGGTIYKPKFVITAAHCVQRNGGTELRVVAGILNLNTEGSDEQIRMVKTTYIHPNYNPPNFANDVAIIELDAPLTFNTKVAPVSIDLPGSGLARPGDQDIVAGWGILNPGGTEASEIQQKVALTIVSNEVCNTAYGTIGYSVSDSMICAKSFQGVRAGICKGDSGSPLFTVRKPYILVGIVSWGVECADAFFPGVYTRVASFSEFIRSMSQ